MTLYFVRHGEADYTLEQRPGEFPGVPLTPNGQEQACQLGVQLQTIPFDVVYCSDLLRTRQTFAAALPSREPHYDARLREVSLALIDQTKENWFEEPLESQRNRLESMVHELGTLQGKNVLLVCHFSVIEFISEKFGKKIEKPQCATCYTVEN